MALEVRSVSPAPLPLPPPPPSASQTQGRGSAVSRYRCVWKHSQVAVRRGVIDRALRPRKRPRPTRQAQSIRPGAVATAYRCTLKVCVLQVSPGHRQEPFHRDLWFQATGIVHRKLTESWRRLLNELPLSTTPVCADNPHLQSFPYPGVSSA
ncbi:hypothetical protein SKAU_G00328060 [Synaphobranchus kaupii]|uniref:Uncharacterized protein n=1 Tax=Synaphobranchus kaupii TaxID=118154 RepID=A0A9Q1EPZ6_SYNKA|nr:hypothetical protein SKAU_G00328060 [Synaphobranchus kaupii]